MLVSSFSAGWETTDFRSGPIAWPIPSASWHAMHRVAKSARPCTALPLSPNAGRRASIAALRDVSGFRTSTALARTASDSLCISLAF